MKKIISILLVLFNLVIARDPYQIIEKAKEKLERVNDYSADVDLKIDMKLLNIPNSHGKIYFKKPNKFKFKSEKFGLFPKQLSDLSLSSLLNQKFTAVYINEENYNNAKCDVIKVIPEDKNSEVSLITLWIDSKNSVIVHINSLSKSGIEGNIYFVYSQYIYYSLPDIVTVEIDLSNSILSKKSEKIKTSKKGYITVYYKNYLINKGIDNNFFNNSSK